MRISGTGITTFIAKVKPGFKVMTTMGLKWTQAADGNWFYVDRGATTDQYGTEVTIHGLKGSVDQVLYEFDQNRTASSNVVTLDYFQTNEKIFGSDVSYTSISATLVDTPKVAQTMLKSYEIVLRLQAISPSLTGTATFPTLKYMDTGYDANVPKYTINKMDSYSGAYSYLDMQADVGVFVGRFQFTDAEMRNLRTWQRTNRGTTVSVASIAGVTYPFGRLRNTFPVNCKLLEISNEEMRDPRNWYATLKLGEVVA